MEEIGSNKLIGVLYGNGIRTNKLIGVYFIEEIGINKFIINSIVFIKYKNLFVKKNNKKLY